MGQAYAYNAQQLDMFNAMTNAEKAQYCIDRTYAQMIALIKRMDADTAASTAAANAGTAVDTEFTPAP
jgi:hypothetical protein